MVPAPTMLAFSVALSQKVPPPVTVTPLGDAESERLPKFGNTGGKIPVMPADVVGNMLPAAADVDVACTCSPVMVNASIRVVPAVVTLRVRVVAVIPDTDAAVIFRDAVQVTVGGSAVLNCQPAGAVSTSVCGPLLMSLFIPSVTTMLPSVVKPGEAPPTARLEQMFVPPVAAVTVINASALLISPRAHTDRSKSFFIARS